MIDTHCHLNFKAFKDDLDEVVARAKTAGVLNIINVGSQWDTSVRAVELTKGYQNLFAAVALHPIHLYELEVDEEELHFKTRAEVFDVNRYRELAQSSSKVVAIGECGLDYYHWPPGVEPVEVKQRQAEVFRQHIKLATELKLPLIIHCREAYDDLLKIISEFRIQNSELRGVAHCFLGTREQARQFLALGFYLSFTAIITFKSVALELLEVVKATPLNKIMVETDAPYLAPQAYRGSRNEPAYVVETAKKIAELKGLSYEEVDKVTTSNAQQLFNLA
ncbi:MAG: TatD family hydrolase [Candidatus Kerfeldbacteria bacterium]|nr:TatD family hydrolase [Candidatus Kerfeldbacteria bacterium]